MKIVNVVQLFNVGGIQKLLLDYLRYFKDKGVDYEVVVLSSNQNSNFEIACKKENLNIKYLNCCYSNNKHYYVREFLKWYRFNFKLYNYLKKRKPDIVHTHNTRVLPLIETCIKKTYKKYKWFHTLHSDPYAVNDATAIVAKRIFKNFDVNAVCLNETQFLKAKNRYGLNKCIYLYNALDFERINKNIVDKNKFRNNLGIGNDSFVIGAIGRLSPVKNYPFLLKIFGSLFKNNKNSFLLICGLGSEDDFNDLLKVAENEGFKNNLLLLNERMDVQNVYNAIDVFVQVSFTEASPLTVLEAQFFGKKCVVSTAIPKESVCKDNLVVRMSLDEPVDVWVQQIQNPTRFDNKYSNIDDYSIVKLSKKLIDMYNKY